MTLKIPYFNQSKTCTEMESAQILQHAVCARLSLSATQSTQSTQNLCDDAANSHIQQEATHQTDEHAPSNRSNSPNAPDLSGEAQPPISEDCASSSEAITRNGRVIHVLKRDGHLQPLSSKKVRARMRANPSGAAWLIRPLRGAAPATPQPPHGGPQRRLRLPRSRCRQGLAPSAPRAAAAHVPHARPRTA